MGTMAKLRVTVDWLEGLYHGVEWPPSPWRVYQALVAGSAMERRRAPELEAALRHLETLSPPVVTAPRAAVLRAVRASVPDNDGDRVLALAAKGKPGAARTKAAKLASFRTRRARRFAGTVTYEWEALAETAGHFQALGAIARSVSAVGQGIDLALARAELLDAPSRPQGVRYTPSPDGRLALGVPWPGGFDALQMRYRRERTRIDPGRVATRIEFSPRSQGYRSELELPRVRWAAFTLRTPADGRLVVDGARTVEVAAMVRHAIGCAAQSAGLGKGAISELMGHGGDGRISVQPLPNVGYQHADGRIPPGAARGAGVRRRGRVAERGVAAAGRGARRAGVRRGGRHAGADRGARSDARPVPWGGAVLDERDPGGAAGVRQRAGPGASGALGAKAPSPRGGCGGAPRAGGVLARVVASREHSPAVVPAPGAPLAVSVPAPHRRVGGPGPGAARTRRGRRVRARASGSGARGIPRPRPR